MYSHVKGSQGSPVKWGALLCCRAVLPRWPPGQPGQVRSRKLQAGQAWRHPATSPLQKEKTLLDPGGGLSPQIQIFFRKNPPEPGSLYASEGIQSCPGGCWKRSRGCVLRHGGPQSLSVPFPFFLTASWGLGEMCSAVHLGLPSPPPAHPTMQHGVRNTVNTLDLQECLLRDIGCFLPCLHPFRPQPSKQKDGNSFLPRPLLCFHDPVQASPAWGEEEHQKSDIRKSRHD